MINKYIEDFGIGSGALAILSGLANLSSIIAIIGGILGIIATAYGLFCKIHNRLKKADTNGNNKIDIKEFVNAILSVDVKESAKELRDKVKDIQEKIKENDNGNNN